jgi:hypothetical protein
MPPHPEVPAALRKLRDAGFRLFTLTDNLLEVQTRQLEHGGIVDLFERRFSADGVKHHKPSPEAYAYVEKELGAEPSQLCLVGGLGRILLDYGEPAMAATTDLIAIPRQCRLDGIQTTVMLPGPIGASE